MERTIDDVAHSECQCGRHDDPHGDAPRCQDRDATRGNPMRTLTDAEAAAARQEEAAERQKRQAERIESRYKSRGVPPAEAERRAASLLPSASSAPGGGPTKTRPASSTADAKAAFSDRNP